MIRKLLAAYEGSATITRLEFAAGLVASCVLLGLAIYMHSRCMSAGQDPVFYVAGRSVLELLFLVIIAPIVVARLRGLRWPVSLAMILIPAWLFGPKNMFIYDAAWSTGRGLWGIPSVIGNVSIGAALVLLVVLLVVRSASPGSGNA